MPTVIARALLAVRPIVIGGGVEGEHLLQEAHVRERLGVRNCQGPVRSTRRGGTEHGRHRHHELIAARHAERRQADRCGRLAPGRKHDVGTGGVQPGTWVTPRSPHILCMRDLRHANSGLLRRNRWLAVRITPCVMQDLRVHRSRAVDSLHGEHHVVAPDGATEAYWRRRHRLQYQLQADETHIMFLVMVRGAVAGFGVEGALGGVRASR